MTEISIEKDIPIPAPRRRRYRKGLSEAIARLQVGDSFLVEEEVGDSLRSNACHLAKSKGITLTIRRVEGGHRVWRMA